MEEQASGEVGAFAALAGEAVAIGAMGAEDTGAGGDVGGGGVGVAVLRQCNGGKEKRERDGSHHLGLRAGG